MFEKSSVTVIVKAYPQPSKKHAETVCCAGIDPLGNWRRLFPVRFRQLSGHQAFSRWDIVQFSYSRPTDDNRQERCRVHEESILVTGTVTKDTEKESIVARAIVPSEKFAIANNMSLALVRPRGVRFKHRRRSLSELEEMRSDFAAQAKQATMFDKDLDLIEPCPFEFKMQYDDDDGPHEKICGDWETSAAFFNLRRYYAEHEVLRHLEQKYIEEYPLKGLVFALGNMKKRPQTWQLLGVFPCAPTTQLTLKL